MKDPLINILINLYGEDFHEDFEEHLALLKEINNYYRRKRANIEEESLNCWYDYIISSEESHTMYENNFEPYYWSYSQWFKEVFIEDYNKALIEVEQQTVPSNRELCILRLAREARYKNVTLETIYKFCREYLINTEEYSMFWNEYYNTKS